MHPYTEADALHPLLDYVRRETDAGLRVAALDAAARFPLDEEGWFELARSTAAALADLEPGTDERRGLLRVAAQIPLLSVRRRLREMALDPSDPDAGALADALADVGDPSQVDALAERIAGGELGRLAELAAMPVEHSTLAAAGLPELPADADPTLRLWRAVVLARLGECEALDAYLTGEVDPPPLFWGDPWTAHAALATVRPLPPELEAHLLAALPGAARIDQYERAAMARLIVWACTGTADAEGSPLGPPAAAPGASAARDEGPLGMAAPSRDEGPLGMAAPSRDEGPVGMAAPNRDGRPIGVAAAEAAARVLESVSGLAAGGEAPAPADLDALAGLAPAAANAFVVDLLDRACRCLQAGAAPQAGHVTLGNAVIDAAERLPATGSWPVERLAEIYLRADPAPLDRGQFAWLIARAPATVAVAGLMAELMDQAAAAERRRVLELLGEVGATQAGRAGSPWRGAGGGGTRPARPALIDDEPEMAMAGPPDAVEGPYSMAPETAGAGAGEDEQAGAPEPPAARDERRVHAQIWCGGVRRNTFVAGADHVLRVWIGMPEREHAAVADHVIPQVDLPAAGLPLTVQLEWRGQTPAVATVLPASPEGRTGDCDLPLRVAADERYVGASVAFLYANRMFELVQVEAFVLQPGEPELPHHEVLVRVQIQKREVVELDDRTEYDATFVWGDAPAAGPDGGEPVQTLLEFGAQGAARYSLGKTDTAVEWLNKELFVAEKNLVRSRERTGAAGAEPVLDDGDETTLEMLRHLAQHGAEFFNQLTGQHFRDPGRRIQLLNRTPDEYMPLELVYDRGFPADDAALCDGWMEALAGDADECPCCGPVAALDELARDNTPVICPLGFWSLRKIIERIDPNLAGAGGEDRSVPRRERRTLGPIDRALFGASHRVAQKDRDDAVAALRRIIGRVEVADDWISWREAIRPAPVPLLVALPHHGVADAQDYLELGGDETPEPARILKRGRLQPLYVNPDRHDPGPIVLLIGCETAAESATGYPALARRFQQLHTAIVVGTMAKVLGRHAAPVASELATQLATVDDPDADFGTIMRRVRRRMLLKGYLMAMCLVALGDGDWRLGIAPRAGPAAPAEP